MAPPARSTLLWAVLKYTPFAIVTALFLFAWGTLTFSLAISYNIVRGSGVLKGLLELIITQMLAGLAFASFLTAVFRNPGTTTRGTRPFVSATHDVTSAILPERDLEYAASHRAGSLGRSGNSAEYGEEERTHEHDDEVAANAPLLPDAGIIPGQPRFPSRTGRQQFNDLLDASTSAGRIKASGLMVKSSGDARWCAKCDAPKPDRAHHCSTCGVCVLRMDHHCPWLGSSCVGLRNHKAFFLFLFHTSLFCAYAFQETLRALIKFVVDEEDGFEQSPVSWAAVLFIGFIFGAALIPFTGYHAYLICRNRTTIESMEGSGRIRVRAGPSSSDDARTPVQRRLQSLMGTPADTSSGQTRWKHDEALTREERKALKRAGKVNIYDLGISENWKQVMGRQWWLWGIPIGEPESDGMTYLVDAAKLRQLQEITSSVREGGTGLESRSRASFQPQQSSKRTPDLRSESQQEFVLYDSNNTDL